MENLKKEEFSNSREAAKITLDKISSWEELNAFTQEEADKKFKEKTKESWKDFAVHGTFVFDKKEGKQVFKPFTDLDGKCALGVLKIAGINTENLSYIKPGQFLEGAINIDTGDKFGVVYEEPTYTAYFDHHAPGTKEVTSATEIVYQSMVDLGLIEKNEALDRLIDFVNKIDNRQFPPEEFLRSSKTILGLQRDLSFEKLFLYFQDYEIATQELEPEQFEKYGLKEAAEKQKAIIEKAMQQLKEIEKQGNIVETQYGKIVLNINNQLEIGAPAAYVKYDGIVNYIEGQSFFIGLKEKNLNEKEIRQRLGEKFQGKIIRGKMWLYNDPDPLNLNLEEIINALK